MLSKASITKYSALLIALSAGAFVVFSWHAPTKIKPVSNSSAASSSQVNAPASNTGAAANSTDAASSQINTDSSKAEAQAAAAKVLSKAEVQAIAAKSDLNNYVLKVIHSFDGYKYPYLLNDDYEHYNGVTENLFYKGSLIAKANPDGSRSSHCVGLTFEVFLKAMRQRNKEAGLSPDNFNKMTLNNMNDFLLTWYNALGTPKSEGDQLAGAIVKYGLGTQITQFKDAKSGDFIDFSRSKSGHAAVFINWLKDGQGNIVGFKYWSTQESTNGISYKSEYFSDNPQSAFKGTVDRNQLYIGRVSSIKNYRPF